MELLVANLKRDCDDHHHWAKSRVEHNLDRKIRAVAAVDDGNSKDERKMNFFEIDGGKAELFSTAADFDIKMSCLAVEKGWNAIEELRTDPQQSVADYYNITTTLMIFVFCHHVFRSLIFFR